MYLVTLGDEALGKKLTKGTKANNANAKSCLLFMPCIRLGLVVKGHCSIQSKDFPATCNTASGHVELPEGLVSSGQLLSTHLRQILSCWLTVEVLRQSF